MRKLNILAAAVVLWPMAAMAQTNSMTGTSAASGVSLSAADRHFIREAATSGMAEVKDGQLAAAKGDPAVMKIANRMVADHTKANTQLAAIAAAKGLALPATVTPREATMHAQLAGLTGASFDSTYLREQRAAHETAIALFETEANSGTDPELKRFAQQTLPVLKMHLQMIEAAQS